MTFWARITASSALRKSANSPLPRARFRYSAIAAGLSRKFSSSKTSLFDTDSPLQCETLHLSPTGISILLEYERKIDQDLNAVQREGKRLRLLTDRSDRYRLITEAALRLAKTLAG